MSPRPEVARHGRGRVAFRKRRSLPARRSAAPWTTPGTRFTDQGGEWLVGARVNPAGLFSMHRWPRAIASECGLEAEEIQQSPSKVMLVSRPPGRLRGWSALSRPSRAPGLPSRIAPGVIPAVGERCGGRLNASMQSSSRSRTQGVQRRRCQIQVPADHLFAKYAGAERAPAARQSPYGRHLEEVRWPSQAEPCASEEPHAQSATAEGAPSSEGLLLWADGPTQAVKAAFACCGLAANLSTITARIPGGQSHCEAAAVGPSRTVGAAGRARSNTSRRAGASASGR